MSNTQKLSIRVLRDGLAPADAVRDGVDLTPWDKLEGALILLATLGGGAPKWAGFPAPSAGCRGRPYAASHAPRRYSSAASPDRPSGHREAFSEGEGQINPLPISRLKWSQCDR